MASSLQVAADVKNLASIRRFIEETAGRLAARQDTIADLVQAADEAATNVILHGYRGEPGTIEIELGREEDWLVLRMRDQAPPFDPTTVPPPDLTLPLAQRPLGGLGIYLMRRFTDSMTYRPTPEGGNELTLAKRAVAGDEGDSDEDYHTADGGPGTGHGPGSGRTAGRV